MSILYAGQAFNEYSAQRTTAMYNMANYEQMAKNVARQKEIEASQYDRAIRKTKGTSIARIAKSGVGFGGSPIDVMYDTLTEMEYDKQIGQYNLEVKRRQYQGAAQMMKMKKKVAKYGFISSLLNIGALAAGGMMKAPAADPVGGPSNYPGGYKHLAF